VSKFFVGLDLLDVFDVSQFWVVEVVGDNCRKFSSNVNVFFGGSWTQFHVPSQTTFLKF
jgi:hypothetical protein